LPEEKLSRPYEPLNGVAGHEGNAPMFVISKDHIGADGKREQVEGPTNINHNRVRMLHARGIIDDEQLAAAELLEMDWYLAQIMPVASSVMVGNGGGGAGNLPNDAKVAAMKRHGEARNVLGRAWAIVEAVCCRNLRVDEAASQLHIHPRRATGQLEIGLDVLALHYGLR
jgi:hypothetical protein